MTGSTPNTTSQSILGRLVPSLAIGLTVLAWGGNVQIHTTK
jgi:hypothetical protein